MLHSDHASVRPKGMAKQCSAQEFQIARMIQQDPMMRKQTQK